MSADTAVLDNMDEAEYHAHPALSATGMKWLLRSPLHYRQMIDNRVEKAVFDLGHAVHAKVHGVGAGVIAIPENVLSKSGTTGTNAARDFIEKARAKGLVPLKAETVEKVDRIAEAVLRNVKARNLLELPGRTELSLFATDEETGVQLRGRLDRLTDSHIPIDLKSTGDVRRYKIQRTIEDFGYDIQAETYRTLVRLALGVEPRPMQLIFVETDPPHEVRVVQLAHEDWINVGRSKMRAAIRVFARCAESGEWPGEDDQSDEIEAIEPLPYYLMINDHLEEVS
ncbi:PD-(D/E)XK nuclease-like domain-containing protein [Aeromicrobium sp. 9AM]|uniref:PD-(D/E)XK nuclease-like domain-containing protein n=1 Tax=Aeromicrobium sp. 9AM TaxID=2653126 RepID=UPI0012F45A01|nr:PD-(D/E)XK nuclease-like domain-containing protein [Aeromicrobium sp. 9AM]VXC07130.1 conserved hypothetical protein [Aeromicrobium sp. 9AM]